MNGWHDLLGAFVQRTNEYLMTLAVLLTTLVLSAPTASGARRRPFGGQIKIPVISEIRTTDPARVFTEEEFEIAKQLHATLYRMSPDGFVPVLAQELPRMSEDGMEMTVKLRPGLQFHDGSSITAGVLISSWERLVRRETASPYWWLLAPVKGVPTYRAGKSTRITGLERVNRLTVRIRLGFRFPGFIEVLAALPTAPLPTAFIKAPGNLSAHPPGSGPFAWDTAVSAGDEWMLKSNLSYPQGRPFLDRIVFARYPSLKAADLAFQLGQVQLTYFRSTRLVGRQLMDDGPRTSALYLALNADRVQKLPEGYRHAVSSAIDRRSLVRYLVGDRGIPTDELISGDAGELDEHELVGDPKRARDYFKQLVVKAGGLPPVLVFLVCRSEPLERAVAERIQVNLVDVGVVVSIVNLERTEFESRLAQGNYDLYLAKPLPLIRSPQLQLLGVLAESSIGGGDVENAVTGLLRSYSALPTDDNRDAVVREIARRYRARLLWLPLFRYGRRIYSSESVHGLARDAMGGVSLEEIWLKDKGR